MNKKSQIAELFLSFAITMYYFDLLIKGYARLFLNNINQNLLFIDLLLYVAFTLVYVPISGKYVGVYKSIFLIIIPTSFSLTLLYLDLGYEQNLYIKPLFTTILLTGMVTLIYVVIKIPVWIIRSFSE